MTITLNWMMPKVKNRQDKVVSASNKSELLTTKRALIGQVCGLNSRFGTGELLGLDFH